MRAPHPGQNLCFENGLGAKETAPQDRHRHLLKAWDGT